MPPMNTGLVPLTRHLIYLPGKAIAACVQEETSRLNPNSTFSRDRANVTAWKLAELLFDGTFRVEQQHSNLAQERSVLTATKLPSGSSHVSSLQELSAWTSARYLAGEKLLSARNVGTMTSESLLRHAGRLWTPRTRESGRVLLQPGIDANFRVLTSNAQTLNNRPPDKQRQKNLHTLSTSSEVAGTLFVDIDLNVGRVGIRGTEQSPV